MYLPHMTWNEVHQLDRSTVAVVPFGAMEQHSNHLPLETDALLVSEVARRLDAACGGELLVLPTQWLGLSLHHMDFAGTLTASPQTFLAMAGEILESIARAGFQKIFILNGHGGNSAILEVVLAEFQSRHPKLQVAFTSYWKVAYEGIAALRESPIGGMGHACEFETSLVMAVHAALVREPREADGQWPQSAFLYHDMQAFGPISVWENYAKTSKHGGHGDPTTATRDKGQQFFAAIINRLADFVREMQSGPFWSEVS
jgi:creatinine amidohydrolase